MAPYNRRPGFSRKAQYSIFFSYLVAIAGIGFAVLFLILSAVDPRSADGMRHVFLEITAPFTRTIDNSVRVAGDAGREIGAYFNSASRVRKLEDKLADAKPKLVEAKALKIENQRLRKILDLTEPAVRGPEKIGKLIAGTSASTRRIAILSIGSNKGVRRGEPVLGPEGLVGRVLSVGPTTSRILLLTDTESIVPVKRASDGMPAMITGLSDGRVTVRPLNVGVNPFKKGDELVTSGNGGLFPPNVPVARVLMTHDDGAYAQPMADPARVRFVIVKPVYEPEMITQLSGVNEAVASDADKAAAGTASQTAATQGQSGQ